MPLMFVNHFYKIVLMFNEFVEKILVINIESRTDRLEQIDCDLKSFGIEYERFPAIKDDNGIKGLVLTMVELFKICLEKGYKNFLVLEDDALFLVPQPVKFLDICLKQLPEDYLCFHLGCNLISAPRRVSENILKIDKAYSTHAIIYSLEAAKLILSLLEQEELVPYDILLMNKVQIHGKSYCTMPMLATQRESYSDIEKNFPPWGKLMAQTFSMHTKSIQSMANEIAYCINSHKLNGFEITVDHDKFEIQHPELIGQICDCKKFKYDEAECGCSVKEWRVKWKENPNY